MDIRPPGHAGVHGEEQRNWAPVSQAHAQREIPIQALQVQKRTAPAALAEPQQATLGAPHPSTSLLSSSIGQDEVRGVSRTHRMRNFAADLKFCFGLASLTARAQSGEQEPPRKIKDAIDNLLGSLTAAKGDHEGFHKVRAQLERLAELTKVKSDNEKSSLSYLDDALKKSSDSFLIALRNGSLGSDFDRWNVLNEIPPGVRRERAGAMWGQIADAVQSRFVEKVVQEPLGDVYELLADPSIEANKLKHPLLRLAKGLDQYASSRSRGSDVTPGEHPLHLYLDWLPKDALKDLQSLVMRGRLENGLTVLREVNEVRARQTLDCLRARLLESIEFQARDEHDSTPH